MRDYVLCPTYRFLIRYKEKGIWLSTEDYMSGYTLKNTIEKIERWYEDEFKNNQAYIDHIWIETETDWRTVEEW